MADEVSVSVMLDAALADTTIHVDLTDTTTMTGRILQQGVQKITTSYEQIVLLSDLAGVPSWMVIFNAGTDVGTGVVTIALTAADTYAFASLAVGEFMLFPPYIETMYMKSTVADTYVQISAVMA